MAQKIMVTQIPLYKGGGTYEQLVDFKPEQVIFVRNLWEIKKRGLEIY